MNSSKLELIEVLPMFALWAVLIGIASILIYKNKLKRSYALILYILSFILGGIILGGIPNALMPIHQILWTLTTSTPLLSILPMLLIIGILLLLTLIIGRQFCGYACPLGALQELMSRVQFKSTIKKQTKTRRIVITIPKKFRLGIRGVLFFVIIALTLFWSLNLFQMINPFLGFKFFMEPFTVVFWVPLLIFGGILITSFFIYRPWCTLACPFGTIANLTSRFSRYKLRRTEDCTDCSLCEQVCPIEEAQQSASKGECYLCNRCVDICPQNALEFYH